MKKYKVTFSIRYNGVWKEDYYSNNGMGFTYNEALAIKEDIEKNGIDGLPYSNLQIVEMKAE
jgi:hypothetical protein